MANNQHAVICPQGNVHSRKLNDPSGYTVMAPSGFKTFRTIDAAVLWATERGYNVRVSKSLKPTGQQAWLDAQFEGAQAKAEQAIQAKLDAIQAEREA